MTEKIDLQEKLDEGYIHIRAIIEMLGKPKEHVNDTLKSYVDKLDEAENFLVVSEEYSEPEEKEGMFSIFVEVELLVKGTENIAFFCFDYLPASVEILEPLNLKYSSHNLTDFLNDLLQRLHALDMKFKTDSATIEKLNSNSEALVKNFIGYLLKQKSCTLKELAGPLGIPEDNLKMLLNRFIGEEYLEKDGELYKLNKKIKDNSSE
jgi:hypothetical protein